METDKFGFKVFIKDVPYTRHRILFESIFLSRVEGSMSRARVPCRGSRVIFFFSNFFFFFGKGNNRCNQCH